MHQVATMCNRYQQTYCNNVTIQSHLWQTGGRRVGGHRWTSWCRGGGWGPAPPGTGPRYTWWWWYSSTCRQGQCSCHILSIVRWGRFYLQLNLLLPFSGLSALYLLPPDPCRPDMALMQNRQHILILYGQWVMLPEPRWKVGSTLKEAALLCPSSSYFYIVAAHREQLYMGEGIKNEHFVFYGYVL